MSASSSPISSYLPKKRLLSGGAWAFGGNVLNAITGLAVNALVARLLTPEEMGTYFLTLSLVSLAAMLGKMGLSDAVVRLVAESVGTGRPGRARAALRIVFLYGGLGSLGVAGILALGAGQWLATHVFDSPLMVGLTNLAAAWIVVVTFQGLLAESFRGFHDIRLATSFGGLVKGLLSTVFFALLWTLQAHANLRQVLTLSIVAVGTSDVIAGLLLSRRVKSLRGSEQLQGQEVLKIACPLLVTRLTIFALGQANLWILGAFCTPAEVAVYSAAARLATLVGTPLLIVNAVVPPLIAEMYAQGKRETLERDLRNAATLAGIPTLVAFVGCVLLGAPILGFAFGDYYREGATALVWLSLGQLVNALAGSCGLTLMMTGHQTAFMKINILYGFFALVGAILLVRASDYGASGVAAVSGLTVGLQNISVLLLARRRTGIWTHVRVARPYIRLIHSYLRGLIL